ncbi:MAG: hypothetical protein HKP27_00505 [Myxococcales bacterium]|nr:hypothetical protein [Myxococcales bacterium]
MRTDRRRRSAGQASVEAILILPFLLAFVILARESGELAQLKQELIVSSRTNAWDLALNGRCRLSFEQIGAFWLPPACSADGTEGSRFVSEMQGAADSAFGFLGKGPDGLTEPLRAPRGPEVTEVTMKAPFPWLGNTVPDFMAPDDPVLGVMWVEAGHQVSANRVWVSADDRDIWHDREQLELGHDRVLRGKLNSDFWEFGRTDRFFKHLFPRLGRP